MITRVSIDMVDRSIELGPDSDRAELCVLRVGRRLDGEGSVSVQADRPLVAACAVNLIRQHWHAPCDNPRCAGSRPERICAMPITLDAYLFFPGNAEQAIGFYQEVFGGQTTITRRGDVDPAASEAEKNQVVNALLTGRRCNLAGQRPRRHHPGPADPGGTVGYRHR